MGTTGLRLRRSTDVRALASDLVGWLNGLSLGPFDSPLVLVPGEGMRRWLSQQIALSSLDGQGVSGGLRFETLGHVETLITGVDGADDPWAPERLVWRVLELAEAPGLELLRHHLDASEQRYANGLRVARLLDRYARLRPQLLAQWSAAESVEGLGLGVDAWQATLWRALVADGHAVDPVRRRARLLDDLKAGRRRLDTPAVGLFCPRTLTSPAADLVGALAAARPVDAWLAVAAPSGSTHPLFTRLGTRGDETHRLLAGWASEIVELAAPARPATLLGTLQADVTGGVQVGGGCSLDDSIEVHASHGLDRQAEVLREALTGLFADDPSLEPRDVVVLTADPAALAPHIEAAFMGEASAPHPASTLRVKTVDTARNRNELYALVREIALLPSSRATAGQLVTLAGHPFVARRFGLDQDDGERLPELIAAASIRWGIGAAHRRTYGLGAVPQGTWQVGVQRLLLGEALLDDATPDEGIIGPVEVESSDAELLGGLAELVSRLSRLAMRPDVASASEWVMHCRQIAESITEVPFEASWQQGQLWAVLDAVVRRSTGSQAALGVSDALALLDDEFAQTSGRPAFGDGSLVVCGLTDLALVPHRVVCLVGLDERSFPRRGIADGDDLVAATPCDGDPDPGRDDRQAILDAVRSADDRLLVIYQGWSSHTKEKRPAPAGVIDLIESAADRAGVLPEALIRDEPLQPFSPSLFGERPRSFHAASLRAAQALVNVREPVAPSRYCVGYLPLPEPLASLSLEQLRSFVLHPAAYFLRERAGLTLDDARSDDEQLPLGVDALQRWQAGDRILSRLTRGLTVDQAQRAEWLRGELPPGRLGAAVLDGVTATASALAQAAHGHLAQPAQQHPVDLDVEGVRVTGRVSVRGGSVVDVRFSGVSARSLIQVWLDVLTASVTLGRPVDGLLWGGKRRSRLRGPEPEAAARHLSALVELAIEGQCRILPMPPRVAQLWAECRAKNADPLADRGLHRRWEWDRDPTWKAVWGHSTKPWDERLTDEPWAPRGERTVLGAASSLVWTPLVEAER